MQRSQHHARLLALGEESFRYQLDRILGGPQNWAGLDGEEKIPVHGGNLNVLTELTFMLFVKRYINRTCWNFNSIAPTR